MQNLADRQVAIRNTIEAGRGKRARRLVMGDASGKKYVNTYPACHLAFVGRSAFQLLHTNFICLFWSSPFRQISVLKFSCSDKFAYFLPFRIGQWRTLYDKINTFRFFNYAHVIYILKYFSTKIFAGCVSIIILWFLK
jgi:hypothetical protein